MFYALLIVALAMNIKPGKHTRAAGMTRGKPSSALNYLNGFKRFQRDTAAATWSMR